MVVNYFVIYFALTFILVGFGWSCVAAAGDGCPFWCCPPAKRLWPEMRYQSRRSAPAGRLLTENGLFRVALLRPGILSPEESSPGNIRKNYKAIPLRPFQLGAKGLLLLTFITKVESSVRL